MFVLKFIFLLFIATATQFSWAIDSSALLPPDQAFKLTSTVVSENRIVLNWDIQSGYYLYQDKIKVRSKTASINIADLDMPQGKTKQDEFFGDVSIYRNQVQVPLRLARQGASQQLELLVQHQGCADIGVCYPPQKQTLQFTLPKIAASTHSLQKVSADPLTSLFDKAKGLGLGIFQDELLPADQAFQFFATVIDESKVKVSWLIADKYYLYREKFAFQLQQSPGVGIGIFNIPRGKRTYDEAFGDVEIFYQEVEFVLPLLRNTPGPQAINLLAKFQGCADIGVCYPPMEKTVSLELPALTSGINTTTIKPGVQLSEQDQIIKALHHGTLWLTLLSFLGFGLLLSATPCVFPMIPILSGIIVGHGKKITTTKAFMLSLSYVLASALMYTIFGVLAALFGGNLQVIFQEPWIIATFSGVFVLLSLSMFGFYQLELPKSIQARLHNSSNAHRDGSMISAAIMGGLSSLIVGPCVAAPLAAALIYIGQTGDALLGGSALFMMGLGMGIPLLLVGTSAGKLLPKAGVWMNATKSVFGVIMLAVAVWMLQRILPEAVTMFLWAMLLIIPAVYMRAIDPLPEEASGWSRLWKGSGLVMMVYGCTLIIGLSLGNSNPLRPLAGLGLASQQANQEEVHFQRISSVSELEQTLKHASVTQQWVMLDFYADWCISCKEMETYTFTDPRVKQQLSNVILVQADVTANNAADQALLKRFQLIGPPGIIFFDDQQQQRPELRVIGYKNADTFLNQIKQVGT